MIGLLSAREAVAGLALAVGIAVAAFALEHAETVMWGKAWLEALVLAILLGALARTLLPIPRRAEPGIRFAAKPVMEWAVALMGASVSLVGLAGAGPALIVAIVLTVALTIVVSYGIGLWLGLSGRLAMLVACGNAICGNSAIAAVAPTISAEGDDVAASIGFTAVLGIAVVLAVGPIAKSMHLDPVRGGILAGMTVYAVPQVLAAAHPLGSVAVQVGALVKLVRVLMLGPVVAILSLVYGKGVPFVAKYDLRRFVPAFILAFLALAILRSLGAVPDAVAERAREASLLLTVVAMAGLGLGVDVRAVASAGARVSLSAVLSLAVLFAGALVIIHALGPANDSGSSSRGVYTTGPALTFAVEDRSTAATFSACNHIISSPRCWNSSDFPTYRLYDSRVGLARLDKMICTKS